MDARIQLATCKAYFDNLRYRNASFNHNDLVLQHAHNPSVQLSLIYGIVAKVISATLYRVPLDDIFNVVYGMFLRCLDEKDFKIKSVSPTYIHPSNPFWVSFLLEWTDKKISVVNSDTANSGLDNNEFFTKSRSYRYLKSICQAAKSSRLNIASERVVANGLIGMLVPWADTYEIYDIMPYGINSKHSTYPVEKYTVQFNRNRRIEFYLHPDPFEDFIRQGWDYVAETYQRDLLL